jgi:ferredoxin
MIVAEQKPLEEIRRMLAGRKKVLAVGCGTCVTVCLAGGRQETAVLASSLRMATRIDGEPVAIDEATVQRQCEWEYVDALAARLEDYDAVLSLGCGVGVQTLAERFPGKRILPALNTKFMGMPTAHGVWEERCIGCGNCILDKTGGVCPVSRCAKQLFNGPCGGSEDGHCEVSKSTTCAWHRIWERAEALGMIDALMSIAPPKDWSTSRDGGPRRIVREDLRLPGEEGEAAP